MPRTSALFVGFLAITTAVASCSFKRDPSSVPGANDDARGGVIATDGGPMMPRGPCTGLRCQQTTCTQGTCMVPPCAAGMSTTVSGTVFDPSGKLPLYNAKVYVPNAALAALADGPSCDACSTSLSGDPVTFADTDVMGHFVLPNVPVGANIPIVIQIGEWRREGVIPSVTACTDTALSDPNVTRLPRNKNEGHIPKIALSTGGADALECLLRKIGIEDTEFTHETGGGRINLFGGGMNTGMNTGDGTLGYSSGEMFTRSPGWWDSVDNLNKYDIILLSCEGVENSTNKSTAARAAMQMFANAGGRVFASHWHNYWIEEGTAPWPNVANFNHQGDPMSPFTATIDTSFPKGMALSQWLVNVGASPAPGGTLVINGAKRTLTSVVAPTQRWIYSANPASVQYMSFTTPTPGGACGKVVFSDLHVTSGAGAATDDDSAPTLPFPTGCRTTELSPQEKALVFMLFDLSSCIVPAIP